MSQSAIARRSLRARDTRRPADLAGTRRIPGSSVEVVSGLRARDDRLRWNHRGQLLQIMHHTVANVGFGDAPYLGERSLDAGRVLRLERTPVGLRKRCVRSSDYVSMRIAQHGRRGTRPRGNRYKPIRARKLASWPPATRLCVRSYTASSDCRGELRLRGRAKPRFEIIWARPHRPVNLVERSD
jgi:hypothetical protein